MPVIEVTRPDAQVRRVHGRERCHVPRGRGRDLRLPGPERRRQDDDDQHAVHAPEAHERPRRRQRVRRGDAARRGPAVHRPHLPGPDARRAPHRLAEPAVPRDALQRARARCSSRAPTELLDMVELTDKVREDVQVVLGRHEAPARDRPRAPPPPEGALPGRAHHRSRPADAAPHLGVPGEGPRLGAAHALPHDALHGRGRDLRPDRDHRPRRDRRARHAREAQGDGRRRRGHDVHRRRRARRRGARRPGRRGPGHERRAARGDRPRRHASSPRSCAPWTQPNRPWASRA